MNLRKFAIWAVICVVLLGVYQLVDQGGAKSTQPGVLTYSEMLRRIDEGRVKSATLTPDSIETIETDETVAEALAAIDSKEAVRAQALLDEISQANERQNPPEPASS